MAEQVQATLDQMVAPLADLMDRKIFTQTEIHAIVARRRESEYLLRRRHTRRSDYLRYIQDELQLEKLRQLRTKKQQAAERERLAKLGRLDELEEQQQNNDKKKHLGDPHIIQNIHLLFRRALRKYNKEDVSVYLQYADVCKQLKSFTKLPQVYAEAVQIHPHCSGLWIEAASHEFFHRQSVSAARILLQRALRINPKAQDLWWQSFALEFHYIAKMQGRRTLLQGGGDDGTDELPQLEPSPTLYAVAKIVYDNAIKAIPDDVSFRLGFLDLCKTFPYTESMEAHIFESIRQDFKGNPKAWIARAAHLLEQKQGGDEDSTSLKGFAVAPPEDEQSTDDSSDSDSASDQDERPTKKRRVSGQDNNHNDPILAMIQKAIRAVESTAMYLESVRFLWLYWEKADELYPDHSDKGEELRQEILHFLKELLDNVGAKKDLSIYNHSLALVHSEFYTRIDQPEEAQRILTEYVEKTLKDGNNDDAYLTTVWYQLAELTLQTKSLAAARSVLKRALKFTSMSNPDYLQLLLHLLGAELAIVNTESETLAGTEKVSMNVCATETFQQVLLLASSGSTAEGLVDDIDDEEEDSNSHPSFGIRTVEQACWQFLLHSIDSVGAINGVRRTSNMVLHQSKFLERHETKTAQAIETLVAFFDKCLEVEIGNLKKGKSAKQSKSERKKDKVRVRQLFESAVDLFKEVPSLVAKYQQERQDASLL